MVSFFLGGGAGRGYCFVGFFVFWGVFFPKNRTDEKDYGSDAITSFASHFRATLAATRYDSTKVLNEITLSLEQYCWNQKRAAVNA